MQRNKEVYGARDMFGNEEIRGTKERFKYIKGCLFLLFGCVLLSGCSAFSRTAGREPDKQSGEAGSVKIGSVLEADAPEQLTLLDNKDTLAADGLYYATWTAGDSVPYENSDGETIDLYDAQLYLLVSESASAEAAEKDCRAWLASAREAL